MVRVLALLFSVSLFGLVGCGSSNQAAADCDNFITNHYCPAVYACGAYASLSQCISTAESGLDCSTVHHESGLALCESDIDNASCSQLVDYYGNGIIPYSCYGVFSR